VTVRARVRPVRTHWPRGRSRRSLPDVAVTVSAQGDGRRAVVLVAEPLSVAQARAWLSSVAADLIDTSRRGTLALVISEIVTNAIRHGGAGGEILLAATPKEDYLCVQVTDDGAGFAPRPRAMSSEEHGGFGLFLVERLTRRWGMTRENRQTRVWFEFDYA
jgi:anti-sigma regulatory factor (Ser/Thr protein kinase)